MQRGGRAVDGDGMRARRRTPRTPPRTPRSARPVVSQPESRTSRTAVALRRRRGWAGGTGCGSSRHAVDRGAGAPARAAPASPCSAARLASWSPRRADRDQLVELRVEDRRPGRARRRGRTRTRRTFGWRGRLDGLGVVEQRLVELLAGPQADVLDRDRVGVAAGQPRQVAREVDDPDRLAHVEHEQVARLAEQRRLEDQPRRLRDRHEVAGHLGVGDRQRDALAELALEERHDAARRARGRCRTGPPRSGGPTGARPRDRELGEPLRRAHDRATARRPCRSRRGRSARRRRRARRAAPRASRRCSCRRRRPGGAPSSGRACRPPRGGP